MQHRILASLVLVAAVGLTACADDGVSPEGQAAVPTSMSQSVSAAPNLTLLGSSLDEINQRLAERGASFAVAKAEYVLAANASGPLVDNANHTIFALNRQLRLSSRWVPGDERREADGNNVTQMSFRPLMQANRGRASQLDAEPAIDASFDTWDAMQCTSLDLVKRPDTGVNPSIILGGNFLVADIVTLGFLPGERFDAELGPGASDNVLGVTFTFVWGTVNPDGSFTPSDVDADGRNDTAAKEVWYNDAFEWTTDPATGGNAIDIETVALHENGHALELGHFGMVHATWNNGNDRLGWLHVSPRAVMNAVILGTLRAPRGTDTSSYCSNFGSWPE